MVGKGKKSRSEQGGSSLGLISLLKRGDCGETEASVEAGSFCSADEVVVGSKNLWPDRDCLDGSGCC